MAVAAVFGLTMAAKGSAQSSAPGTSTLTPKRQVVVSIPDRKLAVLEDGKILRVFQVAVGANVSPSPTGEFQIAHRLTNPTYYHPGVVIPPGKDNPLGPRWVGLNQKGFGIHGTNQPLSIGKAASHGCIRMRNREIAQFFELVSVGDTVSIRGERDEEVAQIFGGAANTLVAAQTPAMVSAGGTH
jgi:lipoprotein-anchoring transpeptidase ErfK/SrfK